MNSPQQRGKVGLRRLQTAPTQFYMMVNGNSYQSAQADFAALLR